MSSTEAMRAALENLLPVFESQNAMLLEVGTPQIVALRDQARAALAQAEHQRPIDKLPRGWEGAPPSPLPWSVDGANIMDAEGNIVARLWGTVGKYEREAVNATLIAKAVNAQADPPAILQRQAS
jgi:hypothetical protein